MLLLKNRIFMDAKNLQGRTTEFEWKHRIFIDALPN